MKKIIFLVGGIIIGLAALGWLIWMVLSRDTQAQPSVLNQAGQTQSIVERLKKPRVDQLASTDLRKFWSSGKCQGSGAVTFSQSPMKMTDFVSITPYGLVVDAHVTPIDHMYFNPVDWNSPRDAYEVRAIADGFIIKVGHRMNFVGDQKSSKITDEWRLDIEHTCDLYSYFDLITSLDPTIASQVKNISDKQGSESVRTPIKAGQLVGRIGGQTLDFGVYNNTKQLGFIMPEHYAAEPWKIHTDDPFPYFSEPLRGQLMAKNQRTAEPTAGKIDYDIDGRLIGNWFKEGTNGYQGTNQQPARKATHPLVTISVAFRSRTLQAGAKGTNLFLGIKLRKLLLDIDKIASYLSNMASTLKIHQYFDSRPIF